jgi:hypothetical protein
MINRYADHSLGTESGLAKSAVNEDRVEGADRFHYPEHIRQVFLMPTPNDAPLWKVPTIVMYFYIDLTLYTYTRSRKAKRIRC